MLCKAYPNVETNSLREVTHTPWDGHVGLEDGRTKVLQVSFVPIEQCLLQAHKVIRPDTGDVAGLPDG